MATLGNVICGFAAIYIAGLIGGRDPWTQWFAQYHYVIAAYLIFAAMVFDALDGRLARFTRHTTDFGGQLDSMADVISFGVAPAVLMLQLCRALPDVIANNFSVTLPFAATRAIWAMGAIYASCAAIRLARFNVSNQHGEQHHFSFLGLPSPGAAGTVAAVVLMAMQVGTQWEKRLEMGELDWATTTLKYVYLTSLCLLPLITLAVGLLMVSTLRYPHIVNRYMRGKKSVGRLVAAVVLVGVVIAFHEYAVAVAMLVYSAWGVVGYLMSRYRKGASAKPVA